jgi:hypothetical protein
MKHTENEWISRIDTLKSVLTHMPNPRIVEIQAETGWSRYVAAETNRRYLIMIGQLEPTVTRRDLGSANRSAQCSVCQDCGHPPTPRDCHKLTYSRGLMLCSDCLLTESDVPEGRPVRRVPDEVKIARFKRIMAGDEPPVRLSLSAHVGKLPPLEAHEDAANRERWSATLSERNHDREVQIGNIV